MRGAGDRTDKTRSNTEGSEAVETRRNGWVRSIAGPTSGLYLAMAFAAGCGGSADVQEIPEASRKALIQRKVDVESGKARSAGPGKADSTRRRRTP